MSPTISKLPQESAAATQNFIFTIDEMEIQPIEMPTEDVMIVDWWLPGN